MMVCSLEGNTNSSLTEVPSDWVDMMPTDILEQKSICELISIITFHGFPWKHLSAYGHMTKVVATMTEIPEQCVHSNLPVFTLASNKYSS